MRLSFGIPPRTMASDSAINVLLIGTGHAAFHLGHAFVRAGIPLKGVVGRDAGRTAALAEAWHTTAFRPGDELPAAEITVLAVSDDAISTVAADLGPISGVVAHLSGARALDVLAPHRHRAVLWPVQTLAATMPIDLTDVPLVIDANSDGARSAIRALAAKIGPRVLELTHAQRQRVHLAAALTSNLPLFLLDEARRVLDELDLPDDLLAPLWRATAERAVSEPRGQALTGPARRGDRGTLRTHLDLLADDAELRRAYALLSDMILRRYGHRGLPDTDP